VFLVFAAPSEVIGERAVLHLNETDQTDEEDMSTIQPQPEIEYGYHLRPPQMKTIYTNPNTQPTNFFRSTSQQPGNAFGWQSTQTSITDPYRPLPRENNFNPLQGPGYGYGQGLSSTTTIDVRKCYLILACPFYNIINVQTFI